MAIFKKVADGAYLPQLNSTTKQYGIFALSCEEINAGETVKIRTGIRLDAEGHINGVKEVADSAFLKNSGVASEWNEDSARSMMNSLMLHVSLDDFFVGEGLIFPSGALTVPFESEEEIIIKIHNPLIGSLNGVSYGCNGLKSYPIMGGDRVGVVNVVKHYNLVLGLK